MNARDICTIPYPQLFERFYDIAKSAEFSAAATCGIGTLSLERKNKLMANFRKAGLELNEEDVNYAVSTIAGRLVNRE